MKLITAIIHDKFIKEVVENLSKKKIKTTKLASTGGFLKAGSTTILIGVEDEELDTVKDIFKNTVGNETVRSEGHEVRGAHVFILDIEDSFSV